MRKRKEVEPSFGFIKKEKRTHRFRRYTILILCVFLCVCALFGTDIFLNKIYPNLKEYYKEACNTVNDSDVSDFFTNKHSLIYASDGTLIAKLYHNENSIYVNYDDLPKSVIDAFVSIEDRRFYKHKGVDWISTSYAAFMEIITRGKSSRGGSTLTQQLARNMYLNFDRDYTRKIREIFLALEMEKKYTKEQILEFYVNNINYSNGYCGIGSAAIGYLGKNIKDCNFAEVALLCAIPNNPTYYNPRTNLEHTLTRRNLILREMYSNGYITREEYVQAIESVPVIKNSKTQFYNYESSYAIDCVTRYFMKEKGFKFKYTFKTMKEYDKYNKKFNTSYEEALSDLYSGGYTVKTSIDLKAQTKLQEIIDSTLASFKKKNKEGVYVYQGASTVIDNNTGKVIAIVGGRQQKDITDTGARTLNRAYQSFKQPGSTIKPLIVYTPSFENGYTPDSIVDDSKFDGGPHNSGNVYLGEITLRKAVEKSKNVIAWKLFSELGPKKGLQYVQKMHFSKITPNDYFAPASLGGLYYGVNTVEMASAYATLENHGSYREPTCIVDILDSNLNSIYVSEGEKQIYKSESAQIMTDVLMGVATDGTAAGLTINNGMPVACKTGTTNKSTTGWFCGYTPHYSCAVYVGADDSRSMEGLWGSTYPCTIWRGIEEYLCTNKTVLAFDLSDIDGTNYLEKTSDIEVDVDTDENSGGNYYVDPNALLQIKTDVENSTDSNNSSDNSNKDNITANNKNENDATKVVEKTEDKSEEDEDNFEIIEDEENEEDDEEIEESSNESSNEFEPVLEPIPEPETELEEAIKTPEDRDDSENLENSNESNVNGEISIVEEDR